MANAKIEKVEVPQPPVMEKRIILELTDREARALQMVLGRIGGHPRGIRGVTNGIHSVLQAVGYPIPNYGLSGQHITNGMNCTDTEFD